MKTTRNLRFAAVVSCAVLLGACATPESRIKSRPDVFARLTPEQQALVKAGKVAPGLDKDAVRLALGDPDRVVVESTASGRHEIWRYLTYGEDEESLYIDGTYSPYSVQGGPYSVPNAMYNNLNPGGPARSWGDPYLRPSSALYYLGHSASTPHEQIRVIFDVSGRVVLVRQRAS